MTPPCTLSLPHQQKSPSIFLFFSCFCNNSRAKIVLQVEGTRPRLTAYLHKGVIEDVYAVCSFCFCLAVRQIRRPGLPCDLGPGEIRRHTAVRDCPAAAGGFRRRRRAAAFAAAPGPRGCRLLHSEKGIKYTTAVRPGAARRFLVMEVSAWYTCGQGVLRLLSSNKEVFSHEARRLFSRDRLSLR